MIPVFYERLGSSAKLIIPMRKFTFSVVALPFGAFIFCVIWSVIYYFERSTATHCGVDNFLPSISAAIGNYQPQRFVWQLCIVLQFLPRLAVAYWYNQTYDEIIRRNRRYFAKLAFLLNVVENFALLGLTLWTSVDNYSIHKTCFGLFIATSEFYMLISYLVSRHGRKMPDLTLLEEKSLRFKRNLFIINLTSFALAGYFFMRHNWYCEAYVYTLFAFFEYFVVLTNMAYHMTAYWDFYNLSIMVDWGGKDGFTLYVSKG